jgi:CheY-like chemotaxis protein
MTIFSKRQTVLVVDDDALNVEMLVTILSPEYEMMTAHSGKEALEMLSVTVPDLIILDILTP